MPAACADMMTYVDGVCTPKLRKFEMFETLIFSCVNVLCFVKVLEFESRRACTKRGATQAQLV